MPAQTPVVLRNVLVLEGTGSPAVSGVTLILDHGKIERVCRPGEGCPVPPGAEVVALPAGVTVFPGLIGAHAHLALLDVEGKFNADAYTREDVLAQLRLYQQFGVTTVVSLGLNRDLVWAVRDEQRAGQVGGARLLTVGRGIGVPGGFPPFAAAPDQLDRPATVAEANAAVDRAAAHHADLVKIWVDSNHGKLPEIDDQIVRAVVKEAHACGLRVAAHVYALEDARRVVSEGVDILAHSVRDKPVDASFAALLKTRGTWYIPTLTVDESFFVFADHPELLDDPLLVKALPASQLAVLRSQAYRDKIESDPGTRQHRQDFATAKRNLKTLYDAGINVGFGTDSGAMLGRVPGYAEHRELALMVEAGLTPSQALACATAHNAAMLRLNTGVIAPGRDADLVIVKTDPSHAVRAFDAIVAVYQGGVRVDHN